MRLLSSVLELTIMEIAFIPNSITFDMTLLFQMINSLILFGMLALVPTIIIILLIKNKKHRKRLEVLEAQVAKLTAEKQL